MQEKEEIVENIKIMYKDMYQYMIEKETLLLGKLFDENFVLIHMTGMRQTKAEYLRYIKEGTLNYYSVKHENIRIELNKNTALLIGQSRVNATVFGGTKHIWPLQLAITVKQNNGKWHMTEAKASTY